MNTKFQYQTLIAVASILLLLAALGPNLVPMTPFWAIILLAATYILLLLSISRAQKYFHYTLSGLLLIASGSLAVALLNYLHTGDGKTLHPDVLNMLSNLIISLTAATGACAVFEGSRGTEPRQNK